MWFDVLNRDALVFHVFNVFVYQMAYEMMMLDMILYDSDLFILLIYVYLYIFIVMVAKSAVE